MTGNLYILIWKHAHEIILGFLKSKLKNNIYSLVPFLFTTYVCRSLCVYAYTCYICMAKVEKSRKIHTRLLIEFTSEE